MTFTPCLGLSPTKSSERSSGEEEWREHLCPHLSGTHREDFVFTRKGVGDTSLHSHWFRANLQLCKNPLWKHRWRIRVNTLWNVIRPSIYQLSDHDGTAERFCLVYRQVHRRVWIRNICFLLCTLPPFFLFPRMLSLLLIMVFIRDTGPQSWLGPLVVLSFLLCSESHFLACTKVWTSTLKKIQKDKIITSVAHLKGKTHRVRKS